MSDPLVLLPGMNCSTRLWSGVAPILASSGTTVVTAVVTGDSLDSAVDTLLDALPDRFALAGLSLGGIVAMALVRRAPARVSRLCLASTNSREPTATQLAVWDDQISQLEQGRTPRELQRDLLPVLLHPTASPAVRAETLLMADETGSHLLRSQLRLQSTRIDERPGLEVVTAPTLVLAAEEDALCPLARHEEIHDLVPSSRLIRLAGAGHLTPLERPREVAEALQGWLAGM